uniref:Uncharacterized protein LOC104210442 n=1 Tax=Nicotiana sylvestris TaxID=4096 RepID=A0A1U7UTW0_NICSY|nr:PREDICTED: uncharacterized protein LOC104210442 [Nicotiana sylvestris]
MKKKLCLCYCPSVVETDDSDHHSPNSVPSSFKIIEKEPQKKTLFSPPKPTFLKHNKNLQKFPSYSRRKIFTYKFFPRLLKAILFQDPVRNIQQLEFELKTNGRNKDEKCFKKLDNYESRKPESEMKVEEVNRIPKDKVTSVSHESPKPLSSNCTKPKYANTSTSCDQRKESCSLLYLIVFALFMTIFLGKYLAILLTLSWLYSVPYQSHYVQLSHFSPKLGFLCFSNPQRRNPVRGGTADLIFRATGNALKSSESKWKVITENIKLLT